MVEGEVFFKKSASSFAQIYFIFREFSFIPYARIQQEIKVPFVRLENSSTFTICRQWLPIPPPQNESHCLRRNCSLRGTSSLLYWFLYYALPLFIFVPFFAIFSLSPGTAVSTCLPVRKMSSPFRITFCHVCRSHKCTPSLMGGRLRKRKGFRKIYFIWKRDQTSQLVV